MAEFLSKQMVSFVIWTDRRTSDMGGPSHAVPHMH